MNANSNDYEIDVSVAEPEWEKSLSDVEETARLAMTNAIKMAKIPRILEDRIIEASVVLANDDMVRVLNHEYRGKDKPTNVLSFATLDSDSPLPKDGPFPLGDVILAYETIDTEAREQKKSFKNHFTHMIVHGTLHLLGYDHENKDDASVMEALEVKILQDMNIGNPYAD